MIIAGLDVATTTGLSIMESGRLLHVEAFRPPGVGNGIINFGFRCWILKTFKELEVEHVAAEEPLITNIRGKDGKTIATTQTHRRILGLIGVLEELCAGGIAQDGKTPIPLEFVHQGTWRKAFMGNGRADKSMALAQCQRIPGFNTQSKDAAEAVGVAWWLTGELKLARLVRPGEMF